MGRKETIRIVPPPYDGEIMQCATPIPQPRSARRANHRAARPALLAKIFLFSFDPNHFYIPNRPGPLRGAYRDRHERWAGMRWTRTRVRRSARIADGEAVWSCNPVLFSLSIERIKCLEAKYLVGG